MQAKVRVRSVPPVASAPTMVRWSAIVRTRDTSRPRTARASTPARQANTRLPPRTTRTRVARNNTQTEAIGSAQIVRWGITNPKRYVGVIKHERKPGCCYRADQVVIFTPSPASAPPAPNYLIYIRSSLASLPHLPTHTAFGDVPYLPSGSLPGRHWRHCVLGMRGTLRRR